ncbi:MAG TPA: AAA family ATPase [Burkholderiales bacterium]
MESSRYELPNLLRARAEECRALTAAPAAAPLALAETVPVYDVVEVDQRLGDDGMPRSEALRAMYGRMKRAGEMRYVVRPTGLSALDELYATCPNFAPVIDDLRKQLALALSGDQPVSFTPILLLGEPGLGKTHFAKSLAEALCTGFEFVPMASLTAGWILSGASPQWTNARPGKVAEALIQREFANPLFVLDEIDKAGGDSRYDPLAPLYTLLEPDTAQRFVDEFLDIELDASRILWIATANDASSIPEPILSRMNVYTIERPDAEGAKAIAACVYRELLARNRWRFEANPRQEVLEALGGVAPRQMRKLLVDAMGTAKLAGRDHLERDDLALARPAARQRIGF